MSIRFLWVVLFTLIFEFSALAQAIRDTITNHKTVNHLNITSTDIYLIPPPQYEYSTVLNGFKKDDSTFISVWETKNPKLLQEGPDLEIPKSFNGVKVKSFKKIIVNGYKGAFIIFQQNPSTIAYAIIFGSTSFKVVITGVFPSNSIEAKKEIIEALNSVYYQKEK
jgi:hypothetical protein